MNRRTVLGVFGTAGVSAGGLFFAYQLDQGNIELGDDSVVSETVSRRSESFEFDATEGSDILVTIRNTQEESSGAFTVHDPDGTEVMHGSPRFSGEGNEVHTARETGTYRIVADPQGSSVIVNVNVQEPGE